jgi:hypothetical protein
MEMSAGAGVSAINQHLALSKMVQSDGRFYVTRPSPLA